MGREISDLIWTLPDIHESQVEFVISNLLGDPIYCNFIKGLRPLLFPYDLHGLFEELLPTSEVDRGSIWALQNLLFLN